MANQKISELTELAATPAGGDLLVVVETGGPAPVTKKVQYTRVAPAATDAAAGVVELATAAETTAGSDAARAVTPDGLAGSNFGLRCAQLTPFGPTAPVVAGDGAACLFIPPGLDGMRLVYANAAVVTAGTGAATTVAVYHLTAGQEMLSGNISIAAGAVTGTPGTVDAAHNAVAANDRLRIDIDAAPVAPNTPPQGLLVALEFQLP